MDNPKLITFFLSLLIFCAGRGQRIENIKTNTDAEIFIRKEFPKVYSDFKIGGIFKTPKQKLYRDKLKLKDFYKADFDNNGKLDIVISGITNNYSKSIVILQDALGKYSTYDLVGWYLTWVMPAAYVKTINNDNLIILEQLETSDLGEDYNTKMGFKLDYKTYDLSIRSIDTLIFKWGQFLNYNPIERQHGKKISKLTYNLYACYGRCPVYDFNIDSVGNATLNAKAYNEGLQGEYKSKFDTPSFNRLTNILNYIDLFRYSDEYIVGWTDMPTAVIDVTFVDGTKKHIRDYGKMGGFGLRLLYEYINRLRYSQKWQK